MYNIQSIRKLEAESLNKCGSFSDSLILNDLGEDNLRPEAKIRHDQDIKLNTFQIWHKTQHGLFLFYFLISYPQP